MLKGVPHRTYASDKVVVHERLCVIRNEKESRCGLRVSDVGEPDSNELSPAEGTGDKGVQKKPSPLPLPPSSSSSSSSSSALSSMADARKSWRGSCAGTAPRPHTLSNAVLRARAGANARDRRIESKRGKMKDLIRGGVYSGRFSR